MPTYGTDASSATPRRSAVAGRSQPDDSSGSAAPEGGAVTGYLSSRPCCARGQRRDRLWYHQVLVEGAGPPKPPMWTVACGQRCDHGRSASREGMKPT